MNQFSQENHPPDAFMTRMAQLLGEEYAQFAQSFASAAHVGLRVNTLKISAADFISKAPFALTPVGAFEPACFRVVDDSRPGRHPYHAAGLYYMQEPAAMTVGSLVRPYPGELVLDLAAAPGGKATHLSALMQDTGLLVANDINRRRASILADNLARWGARNVLISNDTPERLADQFGAIFDKALLDAPCSGEGMFRRQGAFEWSEAIVAACARRQREIMPAAARLVRPGGLLVYATCTFAPEEDEMVVAHFLETQPEFELAAPPHFEGFASGRPEWLDQPSQAPLQNTLRLWPHRFAGEGHFVALLRRQDDGIDREIKPFAFRRRKGTAQAAVRLWQSFAQENLAVNFAEERLVVGNGRVYLLPEKAVETGSIKLLRYGLLLGEARKQYFRPAHTLALALAPGEVQRVQDWPADAQEIQRYLAGEDMAVNGRAGWTLVAVDGFSLGWGKQVGDRLKNHYPRHLRQS